MKLISWNVNGLRAVHKKGAWSEVLALAPDILCVQETKAQPAQLPDEVREVPGYYSYFTHPTEKKGYSGVATYTKQKPIAVEYALGKEDAPYLDTEGRLVITVFTDFVLANVYFPNGGRGPDRISYKLEFYDEFLGYVERYRKSGTPVIFCGDINTAHEEIDLARPRENKENTGFLPEEREWLDEVVRQGYIDTFRHFFPSRTGAYTYWDLFTGARDRNVGWRIDYFFASSELLPRLKSAAIHNGIYGSDHCPIELVLTDRS